MAKCREGPTSTVVHPDVDERVFVPAENGPTHPGATLADVDDLPDVTPPDGNDLDALVARIDRASAGANGPLEVSGRLSLTEEERQTPAAAVFSAFLYDDRIRGSNDPDYFIPMLESADFSNPPRVRDMPRWAHETWERCASRVREPVARARLHDLCFEARHGNGRDHARAAAEAYLELSSAYPSADPNQRVVVAMGTVRDLERALELARRTRQDDLANSVLERLTEVAEIAFASEDNGPGVILGFIEPLVTEPATAATAAEFLERARERFKGNLWQTISTIQVQLSQVDIDTNTRAALHRDAIEALLAEAEKAPPLVAIAHLETAAERAHNHGLGDLRDEAIRRLQTFRGEDLGLVAHKVEFSLPKEAVEGLIDSIVGHETWQECLVQLVAMGPPSGRVEQNMVMRDERRGASPLLSSLPTMRLGADGLPRASASSAEEREEYGLTQMELLQCQIWGAVFTMALARIVERFSPIDEDDLASLLSRQRHVPPSVGRALARAVGRYFDGDYESAAFSIVPRIERLSRELLLAAGVSVYRPPRGSVAGGYSMLGSNLSKLEARGLDPSWSRFLITLLTRQTGMNLRNELLHGSIDDVSSLDASLVLIAALYLAIGVGVGAAPEDTSPDWTQIARRARFGISSML